MIREENVPLAAPTEAETAALVAEYQPLVRAVARQAFPTLAWDADLLQSGLIGLWQAALHWDGARPFRPFACTCIRHEMSRWAHTLYRWSSAPPEPAAEDEPSPEALILEDLSLVTRIEAVWPVGSVEHYILTQLAAGTPKSQVAASLGRTTWDITRLSRRAWQRVPQE